MLGVSRNAIAVAAGLLIAAFLTSGCGKSAETGSTTSPIRQIDAAALPALGEFAPPLDNGRIEIAGPEGWQLGSRTKGYVVRFLGSADDQYPMILVKAEDSPSVSLTAETVAAFASTLSAQPVAIGDRLGALQRKRGKAPGTVDRILERLIFTTVLGGRTYVLELRTREDRIAEYEDALFAVAAGMRGISGDQPEAAEAPENASPDQGSTTPQETEQEQPATGDPGLKELDDIFGP